MRESAARPSHKGSAILNSVKYGTFVAKPLELQRVEIPLCSASAKDIAIAARSFLAIVLGCDIAEVGSCI